MTNTRTLPLILITALAVVSLLTTAGKAQQTDCTIVWEPPIELKYENRARPILAVQGDTLHLTAWNTGLRFFYRRSTDEGQTWEEVRELAPESVGTVQPCWLLASEQRLHGLFYAFTGPIPYFALFHMFSDDGGVRWSEPKQILDTVSYFFGTARGETVAVFSNRRSDRRFRITYSTDGGATWKMSASTIPGGVNNTIALAGGKLHLAKGWGYDSAGHYNEFVVQYNHSTDLGETWSADSVPLSSVRGGTGASIPYIAAGPDWGDSTRLQVVWRDNKYGCLTLVGCGVIGRSSQDNGESWEGETRFDEQPAGVRMKTAVLGLLRAVTWIDDLYPSGGIRVRLSFDDARRWCPETNILPESTYIGNYDIALTPGAVHLTWTQLMEIDSLGNDRWAIMYRRGVFQPVSVGDDERGSSVPTEFRLEQNYPNPFNPVTSFRYQVSRSGWVSLKVYDVLGREVATVLDEFQDAGFKSVRWDADGVPSGVYYYRLTAYSPLHGQLHSATRAMVVVR